MTSPLQIRPLLCTLLLFACDPQLQPDAGLDARRPDPDASVDAGGDADAGLDAGRISDAGGEQDSGPEPDAGPSCASDEHLCDGVCTGPMVNEPAVGCRVGCGEPCPQGADAICLEDGQCGRRDCTPMTCEELSAECGPVDDGCGTLRGCGVCAAPRRCEANTCICDGDLFEMNNTSATPHRIGTVLTDRPDSSLIITEATIHAADDVDWFTIPIDNVADIGGDPHVEVRLLGLPPGEDYDLGVWYICPKAGGPTSCQTGTHNTLDGNTGCVSRAVGDDTIRFDSLCNPDGTLLIRVEPFEWQGDCAQYRLEIDVE